MRNLQEQVKKGFCYQNVFWPFTFWINCSNDLKHFANSRPSASNFKSFSWSLEQFFLTVGQNNFGNKISFLYHIPLNSSTCDARPARTKKKTVLKSWKIVLQPTTRFVAMTLGNSEFESVKNYKCLPLNMPKGSFNNYVDRILPFFDPLLRGHFLRPERGQKKTSNKKKSLEPT